MRLSTGVPRGQCATNGAAEGFMAIIPPMLLSPFSKLTPFNNSFILFSLISPAEGLLLDMTEWLIAQLWLSCLVMLQSSEWFILVLLFHFN